MFTINVYILSCIIIKSTQFSLSWHQNRGYKQTRSGVIADRNDQVAEPAKFGGVWAPSNMDPRHLVAPNFFPVTSRFRVLYMIGLPKNIVKSSCGGCTRGYPSPRTSTDAQ